MADFDLIIRNGEVYDGSGGPPKNLDIGIRDGRIARLASPLAGTAERTIDASGKIVTPGFVDVHTHYDGQATWDQHLKPSSNLGTTTIVMGNCGVGFAPCRPEDHDVLVELMEGVEEIPGTAMNEGLPWNWETFPEYLDTVAKLPKAINYAAFLGHSALRMYTMGERALNETASDDDLRRMGKSVSEALQAGAVGFSTSRATTHVTPDGSPIASRIADWSEIDYLVDVMAQQNRGIFQIGPDMSSGEAHQTFLQRLQKVAVDSGRPVMFGTLSTRQGIDPYPWQAQMQFLDETVARGGRMYGQTTTRPIIALFSIKSYLPFDNLPAWRALRSLPVEEQRKRFTDSVVRAALVADEAAMKPRDDTFQGGGAATTDPKKPDYDNLFALKGVDWDDPTVGELARRRNQDPVEVMLDLIIEDADQLFVQPLVNETPEEVLGMLQHPRTLATFSDSGAHVCQEMGSSLQTHLLSYWVRKREMFTLEEAVRMVTFDNASAFELTDLGLLRPGYRADLVVFDEATIKPKLPTVETDLPGGSRRLVQKAEGIAATVVSGVPTFLDGEFTGHYPGQVLRGNGH